MKLLLPFGLRLKAHASRDRGDLRETSIGLVLSAPARTREVFGIGWGFDDDCPLRLRLRVAREISDLESGASTDGVHLSFAGFYVARRWLLQASPGGSRP